MTKSSPSSTTGMNPLVGGIAGIVCCVFSGAMNGTKLLFLASGSIEQPYGSSVSAIGNGTQLVE